MPESHPRRKPEDLRSHRFFAPDTQRGFGHRSRHKQLGYNDDEFMGKPVIAILNTWNDFISCHAHFRQRVEEIKRGVWQAGGSPVEVPVLGLSETFMKPTSMSYRNLLAMETEEVLRAHPIDGAVLMGGCDKTTPGLLMGALMVDIPIIFMPGGPMMRGSWRGKEVASGTDVWKYWAERGAGCLSCDAWHDLEDHIAPSPGHCMTMGTASTMTSITEVLGLALSGSSSIPAVHSAHSRMAARCGKRIVEAVWEDLKPGSLLSEYSFLNAITADMAIGGSTNAIVHLIAIARRAGIELPLERFDEIAGRTPVLANLKPSGSYVMGDFYDAGGLPALLARIPDLLHLDCPTIEGITLGAAISNAEVFNDEVIRPLDKPLSPEGGTAILRGNLAPDGAVIKPAAADPSLLTHRGPAVVFRDLADIRDRIHDPSLAITPDHVLVMQSGGPLGAPGMPESGMLPIPNYLLEQGTRDMVRLSDARMSGTSYGTCVLHISPESHLGGPLALVRDGDMIELNVSERRLHLDVDEEELARRREQWPKPSPRFSRGYGKLFESEVTQAHEGCDFRFLENDGSSTPDPEIH
ncbi:MAG: dihydroxy-acid dehydratase [Verrucomicrobiaceae bacterium]|nr:dihydroxy-acid dehydratase [Verrucomicrobiaceae bacterium]